MRLPIIPTLVVAAAVATMIALGVWQLRRADEKAALLAQIEARRELARVDLVQIARLPGFGFRSAFVDCRPGRAVLFGAAGGRSFDDQPGWVFKTECQPQRLTPDRSSVVEVVAGWSADPNATGPVFISGRLTGMLVERGGRDPDLPRYLLFPEKPLPGLGPAKPPSTETISNNHLFYAAQWFFFALAAAIIYALALRRKQRASTS